MRWDGHYEATGMSCEDQKAPSLDDFVLLAKRAFARLPDPFRQLAGEVVFQITDFADEETLAFFDLKDPFELTGLYHGTALTQRSVFDAVGQPPMVSLYRRPILDEWVERGDLTLEELVTHVLVHEIGHHFGLSDDDIHAVETDER
jgi:predicted Zn-dependent protease with MMP-like domain